MPKNYRKYATKKYTTFLGLTLCRQLRLLFSLFFIKIKICIFVTGFMNLSDNHDISYPIKVFNNIEIFLFLELFMVLIVFNKLFFL